ncbi:MAG: MotA/TolQ/ExbB proton channel family protein [Acidobacteriaceae bacterium]|nr:MotA/TolQ/ExbB proton channel family protein [Acidobacteriaceae bacterium]
MILAHTANFAHTSVHSLAMFLQDGGSQVGFSPMELWAHMGNLAKAVVLVLFIMSIWSLAVIIDRALYFSAARKQSREFAPKVAGALKEGRLDEAIKIADRSKKSHLAEVVAAGLTEFRSFGSGGAVTAEQVESSQRALERSEAIVHAKLKKGLGGLATIGSTAPFIGLFGTVVGILNAFQTIAAMKTSSLGAIAGGISEALVTTAFGLLVAIPAVMLFNYFTNKVESFDVEMDNSASELVDYFIKQSSHR